MAQTAAVKQSKANARAQKQLGHNTWRKAFMQHYWLYIMMLPALLYMIIFNYLPMTGLYMAFTDFSPFNGDTILESVFGSPFVGLKYFKKLFTGPWDIIQTWFGCGNGWVEQDGKLVPVHQTAEYKEALDWMRKIYADGLVRPDWATVDTANFQVDTQKGVTGVFVDTMDGSKRIWKYFEDNAIADVNDASKIATMTSVGPINGHTLATTGYNGFYLITKSGAKTEEDVKACLHFLDKMCDPEMMALADYGLKDICYDINADGKVVPNGKYDTTNCPNAGLNQAVPYVPYLTEQNPDYQLEKADYQLAYEESIANNVQYAVFNPALGYLTQSDTYAECGNDLVQILDDARTQYICGQIDEAGLQAAFDQWNARGGTQVIEEVNALYAADKA